MLHLTKYVYLELQLGAWGGYSGAQFDKALKGGTDAARAAIAPELRKLL